MKLHKFLSEEEKILYYLKPSKILIFLITLLIPFCIFGLIPIIITIKAILTANLIFDSRSIYFLAVIMLLAWAVQIATILTYKGNKLVISSESIVMKRTLNGGILVIPIKDIQVARDVRKNLSYHRIPILSFYSIMAQLTDGTVITIASYLSERSACKLLELFQAKGTKLVSNFTYSLSNSFYNYSKFKYEYSKHSKLFKPYIAILIPLLFSIFILILIYINFGL